MLFDQYWFQSLLFYSRFNKNIDTYIGQTQRILEESIHDIEIIHHYSTEYRRKS